MKKARVFFTTIVSSILLFNVGLFIKDNTILKYSSFGLATVLILFSIYQFSSLINRGIKILNDTKARIKEKERLFERNIYKNHEILVGLIEDSKNIISNELEQMNNEIIIKLEKTEENTSIRIQNFREENLKIFEKLKENLSDSINKMSLEFFEKINNVEVSTMDNIGKLRKETLELNSEIKLQIQNLEKEESKKISIVEENITSNLIKGNELTSEKLRILKENIENKINQLHSKFEDNNDNLNSRISQLGEKVGTENNKLVEEIKLQIQNLEKEESKKISIVEENITSNLIKGNELTSEKLRILKENIENKINQLHTKFEDNNDNLNSRISQIDEKVGIGNDRLVEEINRIKDDNLNYMNTVNNKTEENIHNLKLDMENNYNSLLNEVNALNVEIKEVSKERDLVVNSIKKLEESVIINERNKEDVFEGIMNEQEHELQMLSKKIETLTKTIDEGFGKYKSEIEFIIKKHIVPTSMIKQEQIIETKNNDIIENDEYRTIKKNGKIEYYLDKRKNQETQFIYDRGILIKSKMTDNTTKSLINEFIYDKNHNVIESIEYVNGKRSIKTVYKNNEIVKKINLENNKEILY